MPGLGLAQQRHASYYLGLLQQAEKLYQQGGEAQIEALSLYFDNRIIFS